MRRMSRWAPSAPAPMIMTVKRRKFLIIVCEFMFQACVAQSYLDDTGYERRLCRG